MKVSIQLPLLLVFQREEEEEEEEGGSWKKASIHFLQLSHWLLCLPASIFSVNALNIFFWYNQIINKQLYYFCHRHLLCFFFLNLMLKWAFAEFPCCLIYIFMPCVFAEPVTFSISVTNHIQLLKSKYFHYSIGSITVFLYFLAFLTSLL